MQDGDALCALSCLNTRLLSHIMHVSFMISVVLEHTLHPILVQCELPACTLQPVPPYTTLSIDGSKVIFAMEPFIQSYSKEE